MDKVGRYEAHAEIGQGGMGVVYSGFDPLLRRRIALKMIRLQTFSGALSREVLSQRLEREARAAAALSHPNILAIYDLVVEPDEIAIVMEYVEGKSLANMLVPGQPLPPDPALRILGDCAAGLDHAHTRGIVHRDIKPGNILVDAAGAVKIADFGIAKMLDDGSTYLSGGHVLGTLEYMAPEQLESRAVDGRTDQYSLAAVAYVMLTGRRRYEAYTVASWCKCVATDPPLSATARNPELPSAVDDVLRAAMCVRPEDRYSSCSEFVKDLRRVIVTAPQVGGEDTGTKTAGSTGIGKGDSRRAPFRRVLAMGAAALIIVAGSIGAAMWAGRSPRSGLDPTPEPAIRQRQGPETARGVRIVYFQKSVDGRLVLDAFDRARLEVDVRPAVVGDVPTNTIWIGDDIGISDAKNVALALMRGGVGVKAIRRFVNGGASAKAIHVGASRARRNMPVMTVDDIERLRIVPPDVPEPLRE